MRNLKWIPLLGLAAVLAMHISCKNHDLYDVYIAKEVNDSVMPIDSVDKFHNWQLYKTATVTVNANDNVGAQWVKILTADPRQAANAEVASQSLIADGGSANLSFNYPNIIDTLYAALVSQEGLYTVTPFVPGTRQVDFSAPRYRQQVISYTPQPEVFVYCFEEEMPDIVSPDFDYNDIVLHVSYERTAASVIQFHVKLAAVGTNVPVSGAIHLKNFKYGDIESVTTVGNASFNVNNLGIEVPNQILTLQKDKELLLKADNNSEDAVINLFCDAHWATGDLLTEDYGRMQRKRYNVTKSSSTETQIMVPREVTYVVTFKDYVNIEYLNFDLIDPFILKQFMNATFEVHPYDYRKECVFHEYPIDDRINRVPWSLTIPYSKFRHPLEGVNIGFKKKKTLGFGAYGYYGHSFGEWSMSRFNAQDWYLNEYATENQVY